MKPEKRQLMDALAITWFLRTTSMWDLLKMSWTTRRMSQEEFFARLRRVGVTPKGTKSP